MKDYKTYSELVASPETHVSFLRNVVEIAKDAAESSQPMHVRLANEVSVRDKPFSQTLHLRALEEESDGWDFDDVNDEVKLEMVALTRQIKKVDSGYDLAHFTHGFEYAVQEMAGRGVSVDGEPAPPSPVRRTTGADYEPPSP